MASPDLARRLKFLISTTRRYGPGHLLEIARQRRARKRFALHPPPLPRPLDPALSTSDQTDPTFDPASFLDALRLPWRDRLDTALLTHPKQDDLIAAAEGYARGRFTALGISIVEPAGLFNWWRDYSSGKLWPYTPHHTLRFLGGDGSDVKYPWELSRMYPLGWLGLAWRATGEQKWVDAFRRTVDDWIEWNRPWRGVNWAMPMEVGIRGVWLLLAGGLFADAPGLDRGWWERYAALVRAHGLYLQSNLEYFANITNHYAANVLGLLALGSIAPPGSPDRVWFTMGRARLLHELDRQVHPDGVHYELSIGYHRLMLEMFLLGAYFAERGGEPFSDDALKKIGLMAEFVRDYTPDHGSAPQFGDSDDGVILRLEPERDLYDHRDTLSLAGAMLGRPDLADASGEISPAALLLTPLSPPPSGSEWRSPVEQESRLYPHGGFAILQSEQVHVMVDVGAIGLHGNNDTLGVTLSSASVQWIVDPGTYCYTRDPELRNTLRSSLRHNAPSIDNAETAPFSGLWRVRHDSTATSVDVWGAEERRLEAHHSAYRDRGVTVRRRVELEALSLTITDRLEGSGTHDWSALFTIPRTIDARRLDEKRIELRHRSGEVLTVECSHPLELEEGWYSPGYGVASGAWLIRAAGRGVGLPVEVHYLCRLSLPGTTEEN